MQLQLRVVELQLQLEQQQDAAAAAGAEGSRYVGSMAASVGTAGGDDGSVGCTRLAASADETLDECRARCR